MKPTMQSLVAAGLDEGMAAATLAAIEEKIAVELKFYYMNDNHTFTPLRGGTLEEIVAAARQHILDTGYTYGMLCDPILLNAKGKGINREGVSHFCAHARGRDPEGLAHFDRECAKWIAAHRGNPDIIRLFSVYADDVTNRRPNG